MSSPLEESAARALDGLADKLGVATERLWIALLRQAPVDASVDLFLGLVAAPLAIWFLARKLARLRAVFEKGDDEFQDALLMIFGGLGLLVACIFEATFFCSLSTILSGFFNPEYWALHEVLGLLRSSHR